MLTILIDRWPQIPEDSGEIDAADSNRLLRLRSAAWRDTPPQDLIVIAGSTGIFAATRELIGCVAALPNGHVVPLGLDAAAADNWQDIRRMPATRISCRCCWTVWRWPW